MSDPKRDVEQEETDLDALEALEARGDVAALLEEAKAARTNKDMRRCLACYEAAARLGSGDANYATALFYLTGQIVPLDVKKGATHLRAAAEAGVLQAKVYVGNLYELGVHYAADAEKADVWYRSASRQAAIEEEPGTLEHAKRMADLGCVRFYLELSENESTTEEERAGWARKARTLGYQLRTKSTPDADRMSEVPVPSLIHPPVEAPPQAKPEASPPQAKVKKEKPKPKVTWLTPIAGVKAIAVQLLFLVAALATGFLGTEGAKILIADRGALPIIGTQPERMYGIALLLIGLVPGLLVYRARTMAAALGATFIAGGIGFWLHGSPKGTLLDPRSLQVLVFVLAGYVGSLLILGILGGAKPKKPRLPGD